MTTGLRNLTTICLASVFAFGLAACGGSSSTTPDPTPEMVCTDAGGEWANGMCTTAEELAAEARAAMQRSAIMTAIGAAETAVAAVNNDSTDAEVSDADTAIANARSAIMDAADVPEAERTANIGAVDAIASRLTAAKTARQTAMDDAQDAADMAMAATATKLYIGIGAPTDAVSAVTRRHAAYGTGDNADDIAVSISEAAAAVNLSEDDDAMVAAHHGWEGKKYTAAPAGDGTYEAIVYSNVGDPTPGNKFSEEYSANFADGELDATITEGTASKVASPSFDQSAGVKSFPLPDNDVAVMISGSFDGVAGTYSCVPSANTCAVRLAASGFDLGGVNATNVFSKDAEAVWTFKPTNPDALVPSVPDAIYASYGWWIHKSANDAIYTASAFVSDKGAVEAATGITDLMGTATYMGGAAGMYALRSSTGGTNDAGHFTADAMLEADFNDDTISGTIDNFTGADGEARNWSVELEEAGITNVGAINRTGTVWTIGGTAAASSGQWDGSLKENGDDGVPTVATGTFFSIYGGDGKMVGAFGANKE